MAIIDVFPYLWCFLLLASANAPVGSDDRTKVLPASNAVDGKASVLEEPVSGKAEDDGPLMLPISHYGDASSLRLQQQSLHANEEKDTLNQRRMRVASFRPSYVETPMIIGAWVIIAGLTKIGFHVTPKISLICPESCLLIVVGVIIGLLLFYAGLSNVGPLTPNVFFLYMLPPIVLDAGYFMPNRPFFDNIVTILLFAVLGTVFNALSVGVSLWAVGLTGLYGVEMQLLETLLFSSIACAVDPIAVLAVFEEIHVNEVLYILVFGESLLNDAVTVVLYHMFEGYAEMGPENIIMVDYLAGVASFFVVAVGGTVMGILWGLLAAFVSRFTHHVRVIEPLFVFVMSYLSYVSAELFHFSGILSLTFCGITMKNYVEENISYKSHVTVKYAMKMLASSSETIIFLFLGVSTVNDSHEWNTWFVVMTLIFCTVYRTLGVLFLAGLANRFRLHRINKVEQFILAYGGLRGAVAFALVLIVSDRIIPTKNMMVTTIIALVFFTVFLQGMTIGPLVRILNVPTSSKIKPSMSERIITRSMDHLMAAIEDIVGQKMGNYHLRDKFKYYNNKYFRPLLTRDHRNAEPKIFETYSRLNLADAMDFVKRNNSSNFLASMNDKRGASFSSLFRSFTANLDKAADTTENDKKFEKSGLPRNHSSFLNVDIGELEYSPSHKDLADAELHHILADAMTKNSRRHHFSRNQFVEKESKNMTSRHYNQSKPQYRYFSQRRRSSNTSQTLRAFSSNGRLSPHRFPPTSNDETVRRKMLPPPELRFSLADDIPFDREAEVGTNKQSANDDEPISTYSSLLDLSSSSHDDEGIFFVAYSPSEHDPNTNCSVDGDEQRNELSPLSISCDEITEETLTERTLPWKRNLEPEQPYTEQCLSHIGRRHVGYMESNNPFESNRRFSAPSCGHLKTEEIFNLSVTTQSRSEKLRETAVICEPAPSNKDTSDVHRAKDVIIDLSCDERDRRDEISDDSLHVSCESECQNHSTKL